MAEEVWTKFFLDVAFSFAVPLSLFLPMGAAAYWLLRKKRQFERRNIDPFSEMPLRPPGESLRLKLDELNERFANQLLNMGLPILLGVSLSTQAQLRWLLWPIAFVLCTGWVALLLPRMWKTARELWDYRLGYTGERVVGEALNQLLADGFRVFHDLPFDGFNIDHVVVGPPGVFVFETKTRRKTVKDDGQKVYRVAFDGSALRWPDGKVDSYGLDQAARNAKTLSQYLANSAAERVWVQPVLVLPGWMVERKAVGAVNVLNPKEIRKSFQKTTVLSPEQIQRIAFQLEEKCRLPMRPQV